MHFQVQQLAIYFHLPLNSKYWRSKYAKCQIDVHSNAHLTTAP